MISGTNESSCLMNPNLVGRFCHNRKKDIYCLTLWIPKRSVTRWFQVPPTRTSAQLTLYCRRVERSRLRRASQWVPMRQTHPLMTKKILNRMCCLPNLDKYDTLVQATHDQLGSSEETFVLWKQRVELLTTAADQSQGSQKMEERRREQGDKKLIWECYVGHEARVSQLLQHLPVHVETYSKQNGWDFSKPQIRGAFLARRSLLHPDEIMMSPRRTPFFLWTISGVFKTSSN